MTASVATAVAFATSGAAWLTGVALFGGEGWDSSFLALAAAYVAVGSLVLGIRHDRLVSSLFGLWVAAVAVLTLELAGGATSARDLGLGVLVVVGVLVYWTVAFVAWVAFGLIVLRLLGHLPDPAPAAFADDAR
jgi:hypothetical protein